MMIPPSLSAFLNAYPNITFIHYHFVDFSGFLCTRCIPRERCIELASTGSPVKLGNFGMIGLCPWTVFENKALSGWDCLYPDWTSLRRLAPEHASVICNYSEEESGHPDINRSDPFLRCPRSVLRRTITFGHDHFGVTFLAGFELEFYLLEPEIAREPSKFGQLQYSYLNAASSLRDKYGKCMLECVKRIQDGGIAVEACHSLRGPQQFQISTGPLPVLSSVDALIQTQEIIRMVAIHHNLRAIFLPKPFGDIESCGLHLHLSINAEDGTVWGSTSPSVPDSFLAGMLKRLPLLAALGMPHEMSYQRVRPMAVGKWVAWGKGNRDTPIRGITNNHWEMRAIDATANMYLTVAGYLASGLLGIRSQEELKFLNTREPVSELDENELNKRGIHTQMPTSLREALDALKERNYNADMETILGTQILDFYACMKEGEMAEISQLNEQERQAMYFEFY